MPPVSELGAETRRRHLPDGVGKRQEVSVTRPSAVVTESAAGSSDPTEVPPGQPTTTEISISEARFDGGLGRLAERSGCGWAFFYAIDGAETVLLTAEASQLFADIRHEPGTLVTRELALPSPELTVLVEEGPWVRGFTCTDDSDNKQVDRTWEAIAGSAHLTIRVADPYWESTGDLKLADLEMVSTDGLTVMVDAISWINIDVGTEQG